MATHGRGKKPPPKRKTSQRVTRILRAREANAEDAPRRDVRNQKRKPGAHSTKDMTPEEMERAMIYNLAKIGGTVKEIAASLAWSEDKLTRLYADVIAQAKADGRLKLRKMQWEGARAKLPAVLIWMGKQHLDQREHAKIEIDWGTLSPDELREIEQGRLPPRLLSQLPLGGASGPG